MDHYMIVITYYFHAPNYHPRCTESHLSGPPEQQGICPPVRTDLVDGPSQAVTAHPRVKPRDRQPTRSVTKGRQPRADVMSPADFTGKYSGATLEISISEIICSWLINVSNIFTVPTVHKILNIEALYIHRDEVAHSASRLTNSH